MMKILFAITASLLVTGNIYAQQFTVNGHISGDTEKQLFLTYRTAEGKLLKDSSLIVKGEFHFKGSITAPANAYLHFTSKFPSKDGPALKHLILDPADMQVYAKGKELHDAIVSGSATDQESTTLDSAIAQVYAETKVLSAIFDKEQSVYESAVKNKAGDPVLDSLKNVMAVIHDQLGAYNNKAQDITLQFISTHPSSYLSAMKLRAFVQALPLDSVQRLYNGLSASIKESAYGRHVAKDMQVLIATSPGSVAPDFKVVDINNAPLQLSSFKGTYVLLDFWASWCVPCRQGNPHLIEVYNKYNSKGFTIIGISDDDRNPDAWHKAVEKDKIGIWHHVLRGLDIKKRTNGEPNEEDLSVRFGIQSLPTKILLDKKGVIIGRYNSEEDAVLEKKLAELL